MNGRDVAYWHKADVPHVLAQCPLLGGEADGMCSP
jgi:hypothetical protein